MSSHATDLYSVYAKSSSSSITVNHFHKIFSWKFLYPSHNDGKQQLKTLACRTYKENGFSAVVQISAITNDVTGDGGKLENIC